MKKLLELQNRYLLIISIAGILFLIAGAFLKITHFAFGFAKGNSVLYIGLVISTFVWILVFVDIFRTKQQNGIFWILFMFLFFSITPIIYLIVNKKETY
ncbi:hypothetical protein [Frigoriflavimonas asaccharolytica]|uniref:Membrane protease YdiL (CAAX protease family) n=1 Tax=Frigoriflavimonas asaccharolytica TaxID=2735899 RepID=A0A8J8K7W6_9FLAO|nr:hypothetical protein [Frigoriflavimonas asaccharolytica]NRS92448.1 membrane protease YdiL (CAAX protease family) [Frigoriflavimonas asaccharolytica]